MKRIKHEDTLKLKTKIRLTVTDPKTGEVIEVIESKNTICQPIVRQLTDSMSQFSGRLMLAANLPYNVAASVMLNLITGPVVADEMYVTVQKEVAERMTAVAGSKDYGVLSIFMAATGAAKIIRKLPPSVFWPRTTP